MGLWLCDLVEIKEVEEGAEEGAETPVLRMTPKKILVYVRYVHWECVLSLSATAEAIVEDKAGLNVAKDKETDSPHPFTGRSTHL